jgi:hypothetical protein
MISEKRNLDYKFRAISGSALDKNLAIVELNDTAGNREANP